MIYLKRLGLVIVFFTSVALGVFLIVMCIVTCPIWATVSPVLTGEDPFQEGVFEFVWRIPFGIIDWYDDKIMQQKE